MSLPVYQVIQVKSSSLEDLNEILKKDMNLRHPVVLNLLALDLDAQREFIGLIENFFVSENISFKFPYAVYLVSVHEPSISLMPVVPEQNKLPKFFQQKEGRMNVKESHLAGRNKMLQQEVANADSTLHQSEVRSYALFHRRIFEMEKERDFCLDLLNKLNKAKKNG
ncbi:MAG: hypothetical protein V4598_08945 [Bdellovibrionota bacterium]